MVEEKETVAEEYRKEFDEAENIEEEHTPTKVQHTLSIIRVTYQIRNGQDVDVEIE